MIAWDLAGVHLFLSNRGYPMQLMPREIGYSGHIIEIAMFNMPDIKASIRRKLSERLDYCLETPESDYKRALIETAVAVMADGS